MTMPTPPPPHRGDGTPKRSWSRPELVLLSGERSDGGPGGPKTYPYLTEFTPQYGVFVDTAMGMQVVGMPPTLMLAPS